MRGSWAPLPWIEHSPLPPAPLWWEQLFLCAPRPSPLPLACSTLQEVPAGSTAAGAWQGSAYVVEAGPHHLELINQLLMQRAHLWVHELLMNCQPDSKDMDLSGRQTRPLCKPEGSP